ncbi:hypothetical protein SLS62_006773 [Diatrype stigma]|uniref:Uncharacterized protein n=1 Tax=Diatrype stigma TaxID=117547 RepID=A0AAN9UP66_9PEZI
MRTLVAQAWEAKTSSATMTGSSSSALPEIRPLTPQSGTTSFQDWASLFTVCLTPLAVHLLAGAPSPSCLEQEEGGPPHHHDHDPRHPRHARPRWHDSLCHYNPTSIMWRYAAIADRRARARDWSALDMAAANALFWAAGRGWDGSVAMGARSRAHCRRAPSHPRVELFSVEMIKTIVVALQGCQAIACMFVPMRSVSLETVFFPLSIFGLARLLPALWLTAEFDFAPLPLPDDLPPQAFAGEAALRCRKNSIDSLIEPVGIEDHYYGQQPAEEDGRFRPTSFWGSRALRSLFCLLILLLLVKGAMNVSPMGTPFTSTTSFAIGVFYNFLLAASLVILGYHFVRNSADSTIIPCISSLWYKCYTVLVMTAMVLLIVLAAIETRKTPCGLYTTFPGYMGDSICMLDYPVVVPVEPRGVDYMVWGYGQFGIATNLTLGTAQADLKLGEGEFLVDEFTGTCLGHFTKQRRIHASTLEVITSA